MKKTILVTIKYTSLCILKNKNTYDIMPIGKMM